MLKEINCSLFNQKKIKFHEGLNVVLGDNKASNSIGKTTLLLIIDFIFGGNSYINGNNDTVTNIGNHSFEFYFEFKNNNYYFRRTTQNYNFVEICDEKYNRKSELSLDKYKQFLEEMYKVEYLGTNFRSVVGNFCRIWGKENYNVNKPLKQKDSKNENSINNLIKLFNKYTLIDNFEQQYKKIQNKKEALKKAFNNNLIPSITKHQYEKNKNEILSISNKIEKLKKSIGDSDLDLSSVESEELLELKEQKNKLYVQKSQIENKIKRMEKNLNSEDLKITAKLNKLNEFFSNINMRKLQEINEFHKQMSNSLKKELLVEIDNMKYISTKIENDIRYIDNKMKDKAKIKNVTDYNVERLAELISKKNTLERINGYYEENHTAQEDLKIIKIDLYNKKNEILSNIEKNINIRMYEIFKKIYGDKRNSPTFTITQESYDLKRLNDTGTGSSYINLIAFDLSVFELTNLPFIIHDSILFKNIQTSAFENLVGLYSQHTRQTFIAIDEINKFSETIRSILNDKKVISLSCDKTLFETNWKLSKE